MAAETFFQSTIITSTQEKKTFTPPIIELPKSITHLSQSSPAINQLLRETLDLDPFNLHHAVMVTESFGPIFFGLINQLPYNPTLAQVTSELFPYLETGVFLHDTGKLSPLLRTSFTSTAQTQGKRSSEEIAYNHLHSSLGGYALQELANQESSPHLIFQLKLAAEIAFGHHENLNGHSLTKDGHPQFSYPRSQSRPKDLLTTLVFLALKLSDVSNSVDHPRAYRKNPLSKKITALAINSTLDTYPLTEIFQQEPPYQDKLKADILALTLQTLASSRKKHPDAICRQPNLIQFNLDRQPLKPQEPIFTDALFASIYQKKEPEIIYAWNLYLTQIKQGELN